MVLQPEDPHRPSGTRATEHGQLVSHLQLYTDGRRGGHRDRLNLQPCELSQRGSIFPMASLTT